MSFSPTDISVDYDLPKKNIARYPLEERQESRLLVWKNGTISDRLFKELPDLIAPKSHLIFNNSKVLKVRLHFRKASGAKIEIFCLTPYQTTYEQALQEQQKSQWESLIGNRKRWKEGKLVRTQEGITLSAQLLREESGMSIVQFEWNGDRSFQDILDCFGELPIPHYLNREATAADNETYQTIYSRFLGSVAAPTAGLHFSEGVLEDLRGKDIVQNELTLHVGAGTFKPLDLRGVAYHQMHREWVSISREVIVSLLACPSPIIAIGTTTVRSLESLYLLGCRPHLFTAKTALHVAQNEPYHKAFKALPRVTALERLLHFMEENRQCHLSFDTQLMILPSYSFGLIDGMITNFHQPNSTLLLLVSAFLGKEWRRVYEHALSQNYRFLSYGDANFYSFSD